MLRSAIAFCLLLPSPPDEFETAKEGLLKAIADGDRAALEQNFGILLTLGNPKVPSVLEDAFDRASSQLKTLDKERERWEKEMEETRDEYDQYGRRLKGDPIAFGKAKEQLGKVRAKIDALETYIPRFLRGFVALAANDASLPGVIKALKNNDWFVRAHAAAALGPCKNPEALKALLEVAGKEKEAGVRVALSDALSGRAEARSILEGWVMDPAYWQVQVTAAKALVAIGDKRSAEALIAAIKGMEGRVQHELNEALKALTGVNKHGNHDAWKEWWTLNKEEFLAGKYVPKPSERAEDKGGSTFYGVKVKSTRILFVLDVSSSMLQKAAWLPEVGQGAERPKGERCLDVAQFELARILKLIPDSVEFNILLLHGDVTLAFDKAGKGSAHRQKAIKFVESVQILDGTNISGVLWKCFELAGGTALTTKPKANSFDTIFLITDGVITNGITDHKALIERITEMNRFRKIVIHAIGVMANGEGVMVLKPLAEATGGDYLSR